MSNTNMKLFISQSLIILVLINCLLLIVITVDANFFSQNIFELISQINLLVLLGLWPMLGIITITGHSFLQMREYNLTWTILQQHFFWSLVWPGIPLIGVLLLYFAIPSVDTIYWLSYWLIIFIIGRFTDRIIFNLSRLDRPFVQAIRLSLKESTQRLGSNLTIQFTYVIVILTFQILLILIMLPTLALLGIPLRLLLGNINSTFLVNILGIQIIILGLLGLLYYRGQLIYLIIYSSQLDRSLNKILTNLGLILLSLLLLIFGLFKIGVDSNVIINEPNLVIIVLISVLTVGFLVIGIAQILYLNLNSLIKPVQS